MVFKDMRIWEPMGVLKDEHNIIILTCVLILHMHGSTRVYIYMLVDSGLWLSIGSQRYQVLIHRRALLFSFYSFFLFRIFFCFFHIFFSFISLSFLSLRALHLFGVLCVIRQIRHRNRYNTKRIIQKARVR